MNTNQIGRAMYTSILIVSAVGAGLVFIGGKLAKALSTFDDKGSRNSVTIDEPADSPDQHRAG